MKALRVRLVARACLVLALGGVAWMAMVRAGRDMTVEERGTTQRPVSRVSVTERTMPAVDAELMEVVGARMSARRRHLRSACALLAGRSGTAQVANPWEFLVDREHRLVWCNVFKAASTSWMYNFNLLAGYTPEFLERTREVPLMLARAKYPRPSLEQLKEAVNDSVSFLIVRHPFERLVSAYRDKIEKALPMTPHHKMADAIVLKYRDPVALETEAGKRGPPTFAEFVAYLLDEHRSGQPLDMHWTPVVDFCTPCHVDFTVLAKFETLEDDQRYLIARAGLEKHIRPEWRNPTKGGATSNVAKAHFAQLAREQVLELYALYRLDFELFDYSLDGYLDSAATPTPQAVR